MSLTDDQRTALDAPIDPKLVKTKPTPGSPKYIEGHEAMSNANRIFGYDGWGYTVDRLDRMEAPGGVLYSALVSVTVEGCHTKQDIGVEIASTTRDGKAPGVQAHDTAMKGAVTDGIKRALRSFGDQFGASLYDKDADLQGEYRDWQREQNRGAEPSARTVTTPAGGVTTPPRPAPRGDTDPWNIQAEVRAEVRERAAAGTVTLARQRDGLAELNGVPLGTTGTDLFESLRSAADLGDLGAAWIAINEHKSALGKPALDVLTLYKEQRKTELTPAPEGVSS